MVDSGDSGTAAHIHRWLQAPPLVVDGSASGFPRITGIWPLVRVVGEPVVRCCVPATHLTHRHCRRSCSCVVLSLRRWFSLY